MNFIVIQPTDSAKGENIMLKIRIAILSIVLVLVAAGSTYFAVTASAAASAQTAPTCPVIHPSSFSSKALWDILNGRYERRVGLPR
jgi:flagellar basal body-associated protein FliL